MVDRRNFLKSSATVVGGGLAANQLVSSCAPVVPKQKTGKLENGRGNMDRTIRLFGCDLNFTKYDSYAPPALAQDWAVANPTIKYILENNQPPSLPQDWAFINPREYFDWHLALGNNVMFCQAYTFGGYAFYPSKLGAVAPGPGCHLLPRLFDLSRKAKIPFWSNFSVSWDLIMRGMRGEWTFPHNPAGWCLAPETPWTDLLCERVREFLSQYPVDWILFDMFLYGDVDTDAFHVQPSSFVEKPFQEIIGRPMPAKADEITPNESLRYKREILARQFRRLRDAVKQTSPETKIIFNVPYLAANAAIWDHHPMMMESDGLFAESTKPDVVEWLLRAKQPGQRVMTTLIGHLEAGRCDPMLWRQWYARGCDFFGYAQGTPPDFRPHSFWKEQMEIIRAAFGEIEQLERQR